CVRGSRGGHFGAVCAAMSTFHEADDGDMKVVIVDDHAGWRSAARDVIEATPGFAVVGEADCGEVALDVAAATSPDLVLMDVRMPGIGGIAAARRLTQLLPQTRVVLLSTCTDARAAGEHVES